MSADPLRDDELDDLREHFVNGSGAYTDSALVGRLVREIDRLRVARTTDAADLAALLAERDALAAVAEAAPDALTANQPYQVEPESVVQRLRSSLAAYDRAVSKP